MGAIKRKLQSKAGASMILALMFLIFCLFVGGSAMAAASANGGRLKDQRANQQTLLDQRSAMLAMADMLQSESGEPLRLTITEVSAVTTEEETGETPEGGAETPGSSGSSEAPADPETPEPPENPENPGEPSAPAETAVNSLTIRIQDSDINKTVLERLLYELAADLWLDAHAGVTPRLENYEFQSGKVEGETFGGHSYSHGSFPFTPPGGLGETMTVSYRMTEDYDLILSFQETEGEGEDAVTTDVSVLHLELKATVTEGEPVELNGVRTIVTTIEWGSPRLVKGGASS